MYAIIKTGGKQYKVREGDTVEVELLDGDVGDAVELDQVLMVAGDGETAVGSPTVEDARVRATILDEVRGEKVVVFKYKPKNRYARKTGHRQNYTRLKIDEILLPGMEPSETEVEEEAPVAEAPAAELPEPAEATAEVETEAVTEPEPTEETEVEAVAEPEPAEEAVAETDIAAEPEPAEGIVAEADVAAEPEPAEETVAEASEETAETAGEPDEEETEAEEE